jgi:hypothetical protein
MSLIWNDIEEHASRCENCLIRFQCLSESFDSNDHQADSEAEITEHISLKPRYWRRRQWSAISPFQTCASVE